MISFSIIIKLMSLLPILRNKKQVRFSNPLVGRYYDNNRYQNSCYLQQNEETQEEQKGPQKSQHLAYRSLKKAKQKSSHFVASADTQSSSLIKTQRMYSVSKKMSNPYSKRCPGNLDPSVQSLNTQPFEDIVGTQRGIRLNFFQTNSIQFEQIEVRVLQLIPESPGLITEQNQPKIFKINLGRYFQLYFKDSLSGALFKELCDLVQKYIEDVLAQQQSDGSKEKKQQRLVIRSKRVLYERLLQLHRVGNKCEIKELLKDYCVPGYETRQICLRNVLSLITNMLQQQYNLPTPHGIRLLDQKGEKIVDFCQIKFSTKKLFLVQQNQIQALVNQYFSHFQQHKTAQKNTSLRQTLKSHFRQQLTHGLYEQKLVPDKPFIQQRVEKRSNLARAQLIINIKNSKHHSKSKSFQELLQMQKNSQGKRNILKIRRQIKVRNQKERYISADQLMITEFKRLKKLSDYQDLEFKNDQSNRNKVQFGIIVKESPYFKSKNQQQIQRIFSALSFTQPNPSLSYSKQPVTLDQYVQLQKIIGCLADRESIISFVDRYLRYDEYGELHKLELKQTLTFVIGGEKKASEVILATIWGWLQKNGVIMNEMLSRSNMRMLYQRNKIVYYLLISLIFGTNETTALDLAEETLV